jgi:hypothetical protein
MFKVSTFAFCFRNAQLTRFLEPPNLLYYYYYFYFTPGPCHGLGRALGIRRWRH